MDNKEIDYTEKMRNFQVLVDNFNDEIAFNYLTKADWDETKAAQIFYNENFNNLNKGINNTVRKSNYGEKVTMMDKINVKDDNREYREINQNENEINVNLFQTENGNMRETEQPGFLTRWIIRPLQYLGSIFCNRNYNGISEEENRIFTELPEKVNNINSFNTMIKTRVGILVLYQTSDLEYFNSFVNEVKQQEYIIDILRENYVIYPVLFNSTEGRRITSLISDQMLYPAFIFAFNKRNNNSFNRGSIIDRLEGRIFTDVFRDALIRNVEEKQNLISNDGNSHVNLINQQKEEFEYLEKLESNRKNQERENMLKAERLLEEKKQKEDEMEKLKQEKLKTLPDEPHSDNPESSLIIFRYPDGNRRVERRFLKNQTVQVLYNYVETLGSEIFFESDKFDLIQPFPFKLFNNMDKTLEEEKLFPNAVLQIREI